MSGTATALPGNGISGPPPTFRQNETITWQDVEYTDRFFNQYDSNSYNLTYVFVGPVATPIQVVAVPSVGGDEEGLGGGGWTTTFTAADAAKFAAGRYWWQAVITSQVSITPTVRVIAFEGQSEVQPDFAALTAVYDGRTMWEQILDAATMALVTFQASGGRLKAYNIAGRSMTFQDDKDIIALENLARSRVEAEKQSASGGDRRNIRVGFRPPSSGVPASNSKNWPWW